MVLDPVQHGFVSPNWPIYIPMTRIWVEFKWLLPRLQYFWNSIQVSKSSSRLVDRNKLISLTQISLFVSFGHACFDLNQHKFQPYLLGEVGSLVPPYGTPSYKSSLLTSNNLSELVLTLILNLILIKIIFIVVLNLHKICYLRNH